MLIPFLSAGRSLPQAALNPPPDARRVWVAGERDAQKHKLLATASSYLQGSGERSAVEQERQGRLLSFSNCVMNLAALHGAPQDPYDPTAMLCPCSTLITQPSFRFALLQP